MSTRYRKESNSLIFVFLISMTLTSPVFAGDFPSIGGFDTGIYLIATIELGQIMSGRKPKVSTEISVFRTTWTFDEMKSCWIASMKNCVQDHAEDYVDEFIDFYRDMDSNGEEEFYRQLTEAKLEELLQRELQRGGNKKIEQAKNQSPKERKLTVKDSGYAYQIPHASRE
ncbi:MAG TPA: hypothetical protein VHT73_03065 [Thermodesulfobacteriota bacterium]|nr:hypothetical protein [Thermodesulfobacteriota bacterium]